MKLGILLAAFGSSAQQAHRTLHGFESKVRESFPGIPVRWAFTSGKIRHHLAGKGKKTDSVQKALAKMRFEGYSHVVVQSLHMVPGSEFNDLKDESMAMMSSPENPQGFQSVQLGWPLLADTGDIRNVSQAVLRHIPDERTPGEAVLYMGHGTWHSADTRYEQLAEELRTHDPDVYLGTMDGGRTIHDILPELQERGYRTAWLLPFLAVAGAHVLRDMVGDTPDSWKSVLEAAGLNCRPVLRSAIEYEGFTEIWIEHLRTAMESLHAGL